MHCTILVYYCILISLYVTLRSWYCARTHPLAHFSLPALYHSGILLYFNKSVCLRWEVDTVRGHTPLLISPSLHCTILVYYCILISLYVTLRSWYCARTHPLAHFSLPALYHSGILLYFNKSVCLRWEVDTVRGHTPLLISPSLHCTILVYYCILISLYVTLRSWYCARTHPLAHFSLPALYHSGILLYF